MNKLERACRLTRDSLEAMDTPTLTNVAQTLGTSGKYVTRSELMKRILQQQRVTAHIYGISLQEESTDVA